MRLNNQIKNFYSKMEIKEYKITSNFTANSLVSKIKNNALGYFIINAIKMIKRIQLLKYSQE